MKKIFFIVTFFLISSITFAQELPFCVGEEFTYDVMLLGFKIGTQIDQVIAKEIIGEEETYHIKSKIKSNPFFSKFYHLSEQIDTWVGTSSLLPVRVIKDIDRKKYHKCYGFSLNHASQKATILSKHQNTTKTIDIFPNTLDSLSLIYYLRNQDLKVGDLYNLAILTRHGVEQIKVNIVKEEEVSTPSGKFMTLKVEQSGSDITDIIVWFTNDNTHIPVKIEVKTEAGRLKAYLRKKKG
ncbi:MAG: DUF3108 domain-containing protein [bacterium]